MEFAIKHIHHCYIQSLLLPITKEKSGIHEGNTLEVAIYPSHIRACTLITATIHEQTQGTHMHRIKILL